MESSARLKHIPPPAALSALGFLLLLVALLAYPGEVRQNVVQSTMYCLTVLVPSLFPFMALCSFAVNSPAAAVLGRPLGFLVRRAFRLPGCCAVPIIMSFIGGYPAGARGVSLLLERGQITQEQAGRMLMFCVNPGLAFVVTFVGGQVLGHPGLGWMIFIAVTASGLLLGIVTAFKAPMPAKQEQAPQESYSGAVIRSVTDSSRSVLVMCACVVLFSGLTAILHGCGAFQWAVGMLSRTGLFSPMEWAAVLSFMIEVTGGVGDAANLGVTPVFYAFGLAFGGACVHLQVFSFFPELPCKLWMFLLCRLAHGLMAAGSFLLLCTVCVPVGALPASAVPSGGEVSLSGNVWGGASMVLMSAAFLVAVKGDRFTACKSPQTAL